MTESKENQNKNEDHAMDSSRFHMWRAIFALAHADHMVTLEERHFMEDIMRREPFSDAQKALLKGDIRNPQDIGRMFEEINDQTDRSAFFYFARLLCWCDGDFAQQEQAIILKLKETHLKELNFDKMLGDVNSGMEIDEEERRWLKEDVKAVKEQSDESNIQSFMNAFIRRYNSRKK